MDFLAAYLAKLISEEQEEISVRALVIEEKETWRAVSTSGKHLLLMPHPSFGIEPELVAEAVRAGHHVVLSSNRFSNERFQKWTLPRAYGFDLQNALVSCGFIWEKASEAAKESGGSMTVLKRLLARFPGTTEPEWSKVPHAASLVPFILAGSWDETSEGDRSIMETLSGQQYEQVRAIAEETRTLPDSPLVRVLSRWTLVSREDSWFLLARNIGTQHVELLSKVALRVLTEDNPALELPPEERWQAALYKKTPAYTQWLRTGISETLVLLACRSGDIKVPWPLEDRIQGLVKTILEEADWKRWTSLSRQLPLLAEASPDAFLDAVELDLQSAAPATSAMFEQGSDAFFSPHPHTGLLWALENLAWATDYLPRAASILARLVEPARKVSIGNHPRNSLREIFLPWHPQTSAPVAARIKVLDRLLQRHPQVAWDLLIELLPHMYTAATPTYRPSWRDWAVERSQGVPNDEYWKHVVACAKRLIEQAGTDVKRCVQIIEHFHHFPEPVHKDAIAHLASLNASQIDRSARREIIETLHTTVHRHRRFAKADWALPAHTVKELEMLLTNFEPQDVVAKHAWLFGPHWDVEAMMGDSIQDQGEKLLEARTKALAEIFSTHGLAGIFSLVEAAKDPEDVGIVVAKTLVGVEQEEILPKLLLAENKKMCCFAHGYAFGCSDAKGISWIDSLGITKWSVAEAGEFLLLLRFDPYTWNLVSGLGAAVEEYYWSRVTRFCHTGKKEDVEFAVSMLLKYHRPFPACDVLAMAFHQKCEVEPSTVLQVLQMGLSPDRVDEIRLRSNQIAYDVQKLITWLQQKMATGNSEVEESRLAAVEWGYLGLLDRTPASPITLYRMLQRDPERFVEVLGVVYRKRHAEKVADQELTEQDKLWAENAYRLLNSWHTLPGQKDGTVDGEVLMNWVRKARQLCKEQDRLEVCDIQLGNVFAYSPPEPDDSWPCIAVRDAIEEVEGTDLTQGFEIGIYNKRGCYMKSATEGGAQEWGLARQFQDWANRSAIDWPKTARSLRNVAANYENEARREDKQAQIEI